MAEQGNALSQQACEVNSLNSKLAYDFSAQLQNQALIDNQAHARSLQQLELKIAQDAQTVSHLANTNAVISAQVSNIETQQTVDPVRTGAGDAIVGGVGVAAEQVAANISDLATGIVGAVLTAVFAQLPALITAVGGSSTPSQTQPKP